MASCLEVNDGSSKKLASPEETLEQLQEQLNTELQAIKNKYVNWTDRGPVDEPDVVMEMYSIAEAYRLYHELTLKLLYEQKIKNANPFKKKPLLLLKSVSLQRWQGKMQDLQRVSSFVISFAEVSLTSMKSRLTLPIIRLTRFKCLIFQGNQALAWEC